MSTTQRVHTTNRQRQVPPLSPLKRAVVLSAPPSSRPVLPPRPSRSRHPNPPQPSPTSCFSAPATLAFRPRSHGWNDNIDFSSRQPNVCLRRLRIRLTLADEAPCPLRSFSRRHAHFTFSPRCRNRSTPRRPHFEASRPLPPLGLAPAHHDLDCHTGSRHRCLFTAIWVPLVIAHHRLSTPR